VPPELAEGSLPKGPELAEGLRWGNWCMVLGVWGCYLSEVEGKPQRNILKNKVLKHEIKTD
jgi:hypothetical protein